MADLHRDSTAAELISRLSGFASLDRPSASALDFPGLYFKVKL